MFIGSSTEQMRVAGALQTLLSRDFEVTPWWAGVFQPGHASLEDLSRIVGTFDFGVVVLGTDDVTTSRGLTSDVPRDNALFELGMLICRRPRKNAQ